MFLLHTCKEFVIAITKTVAHKKILTEFSEHIEHKTTDKFWITLTVVKIVQTNSH